MRASVRFHRSPELKSLRTDAIILKVAKRGFDSLGRSLKARLKRLSPQDTKVFVNSLFYRVSGSNLTNLRLDVGSRDNEVKVATLEKGRARGRKGPRSQRLEGWVTRKGLTFDTRRKRRSRLGPKRPPFKGRSNPVKRTFKKRGKPRSKREREIRALAYVIARSIGKRGFRGKGMFAKTTRQSRDIIKRVIQTMNRQISRELNKR